ncbi:MAG: hypothetical protein F6J87_14385 [Spirulina sp. SIO3F2]|nr:hypothetical protein [Spirulina sp. SIO3F2]
MLLRSCSILVACLAPGLSAQAAPEPIPPVITDASLLQTNVATAIPARGSLGYNSSGSGYEGFAYLDGFFPLWQTVGKDLGYLNSRLNVDENGNLGGNLLLGYRRMSKSGNWVRGAYVAYDQRSTNHNTFGQLGFGLEQLGEVDLRFNAYLPIGNTRQASVNTGLQLRDLFFSGHQLNLVLEQQQIYEAAAKGFDFEVGKQLTRLGSGALNGYAGVYYYDPPSAGGALGYRLRFNADPLPNLNMGLSFQTDSLFGSQASFRIGTSWGKRKRRQTPTPLWERLAESVERTNTIAIDNQVEASFSGTVVATNPETGEAWYFLHVNPGSNGDGQFESPYTTAEAALQAASTRTATANQNTTIYVQDTASPTITTQVPDNVRFWSTGPLQQLNTNEFSQVTLPLSNSGVYPLLDRTVNMGSGSHLAGFTITPPSGSDGVLGDQVGNIIVRENRITTSGSFANGVRFRNGTGSLLVTLNEITTTGDTAHGVTLYQNQAATVTEATITSNTIQAQGALSSGVNVFFQNAGAELSQLQVSNNTVTTTGTEGSGISAFARDQAVIGTAIATGNRVSTQGQEASGIVLFSNYQGIFNQATITDNTVTTQGQEAVGALAFAATGGTLTQATLTGNSITTQGQEAAGLLAFASGCDSGNRPLPLAATPLCNGTGPIAASSTLGTATIANNVVDAQADGSSGILTFAVRTGSLGTASVTGNTVTLGGAGLTNTYSAGLANPNYTTPVYTGGIMAFAAHQSQLTTATISGNTVNTSRDRSSGLAVFSVLDTTLGYAAGSSLTTATVTNNVVTTQGATAPALSAFATNTSSLGTVTLSGNQLTTVGDDSSAISSFASNSNNFSTATITNNTLSTQGQRSNGISIAADNQSTLTTATITGNTSNTGGTQAYGISVRTNDNSTVGNATIQRNRIETTNAQQAHGISMIAQNTNGVLTQGTVSDNTITTSGSGARGLTVSALSGGDVNNLAFSNNVITTSGDCIDVAGTLFCADGIGFAGLNGTLSGTAQISSNQVTTSGLGAAGIAASATGGSANTFAITNNQVTTTGNPYPSMPYATNALGINVSALANATITAATVSGNTINTTGQDAHGVQVLAAPGTIMTTTVSNNSISATGQEANGIVTQSSQNGSLMTTLTVGNNQVAATGTNAFGVFSLATNDGQISSAAFVDNLITQAGQDSFFFLTNVSNPQFCVASFTGNTSQNSVAGVDLQLNEILGTLKFVGFANLNTNNTGFNSANPASVIVAGADTTATSCP